MLTNNMQTATQAFAFYTSDSTVYVNPGSTQIGNTVLSFSGGSIPFKRMINAPSSNTYQYSALMLENLNGTADLTCVTSIPVSNIASLKYPYIDPTSTNLPMSPVGLFLFYYDGVNILLKESIKTAQGGGAGLQGGTGVPGTTGAKGLDGVTGETGIQGLLGLQGETGHQGITGLMGITGLKGLTGVGTTGIQGPQGLQGIQGPIGLRGPQGIAGFTGIQGLQGSTGFGIQGAQGSTGITLVYGNSTFYSVTLSKVISNSHNTANPSFTPNPVNMRVTKVGDMGLITGSFIVTIPMSGGTTVGNLFEIDLTFPVDVFSYLFATNSIVTYPGYPVTYTPVQFRPAPQTISVTATGVFSNGQPIYMAYDNETWVSGTVVSYIGDTLIINYTNTSRTGDYITYTPWYLNTTNPMIAPTQNIYYVVSLNTLRILSSAHTIGYLNPIGLLPIAPQNQTTFFINIAVPINPAI